MQQSINFRSYLENRFQLNNPADTPRGPNLEASASNAVDLILYSLWRFHYQNLVDISTISHKDPQILFIAGVMLLPQTKCYLLSTVKVRLQVYADPTLLSDYNNCSR